MERPDKGHEYRVENEIKIAGHYISFSHAFMNCAAGHNENESLQVSYS